MTMTSWSIQNPKMPDLNDRAADNWRPLLAIADLAGVTWPKEARRAACLLSGEEQDGAIGVELLRDIRSAFGDGDVIRSSDLVAQLTADPERPWAEWKHGRPLTQKQLAGLLAPFHIISLTCTGPGSRTERATAGSISRRRGPPTAPVKTSLRSNLFAFEASKRPNAAETDTAPNFEASAKVLPDGSKTPTCLTIMRFGRLDGSKGSANGRLGRPVLAARSRSFPTMPSRLSVTVPDTTSRGSAMCLFSCRPSLARRPYAARSDAAGRRRSRMRRRNWRWPGTRLGAGDAITRAPGRPTRASWAVKGSGSTSLRSSGAGLPAPSANGCLAAFRVASYPYGGVRSWCR